MAKGEHVKCISFASSIKRKDKMLSYKYNQGLKSQYSANYANTKGHVKETVFNLDDVKRQLRVPYNPPRNFATTKEATFFNSKGTGMIGAMTADGHGYVRYG